MSNVPDLDDEDLILEDKIAAFKEQLKFERDPLIVHRYDSLSLLNQVVFSKDRPRSRLANEYNQIVREISIRNWNDPDGALQYIQRADKLRLWRDDNLKLAGDSMLQKIAEAHSDNGEILFHLAMLRDSGYQPELAGQLLDQAIQNGCERPDAFLKRSRIRANKGNSDGAVEDALKGLVKERIEPPMVREAIGHLMRLGKHQPKDIVEFNAVANLDFEDKFWLADTFDRSREDLSIAVALWEQIVISPNLPVDEWEESRLNLGLSYMGLGLCSDAAKLFRSADWKGEGMEIITKFNLGMALWGMNGIVDREIFQCVIKINESKVTSMKSPNFLQCMAIAYWAVGETDTALKYVNKAYQSMMAIHRYSEFSCWRYLQVSRSEFSQDLNEIREMIENNEVHIPHFIRSQHTAS